MPENKFTSVERLFAVDDLSTGIISPNALPPRNNENTADSFTLKLGLNNVVFGNYGYRELEPLERHVFNCLLIQRGKGISWPLLVETGLYKRSDDVLNYNSFSASLNSLGAKLRSVTSHPVIQEAEESGWYDLHQGCDFVDARQQILRQHATWQEEDKDNWPQRERGAAIAAILLHYGNHYRCVELAQEFRHPQEPSRLRVPSHEEMRALFASLEGGISIIMENAREGWQPTPAQHQQLIEAAAAYTVLIRGNQGLVRRFTRDVHTWMDEDDRIQIGNMALARAIEAFDPGRGFAFSTYAVRCIKNTLIRERRNERTIVGPAHIEEAKESIEKGLHTFWTDHGRSPTYEELSPLIGIPADKIRQISLYFCPSVSLDETVGEDGTERSYFLTSEAEDTSTATERVDAIFDLPILDREEKLVLSLHFGIYNEELADTKIHYSGGVQRYQDCFHYLYAEDQLNLTEIGLLLNTDPKSIGQCLRQAVEKIKQSGV